MARAVLVLALAVGLLAGCGDEDRLSKAEYERKVQAVYADVQRSFRATDVASLELLARRVEAAQAELQAGADALDERKPPKDVEQENRQLVAGLREYAAELGELLDAANRGDLRGVEAFNAAIPSNEAVEEIAEAAEKMKFKGYDLGPIAEE